MTGDPRGNPDQARRVLEQHLRTSLLMGVDFLPRGPVAVMDVPSTSETTAETPAQASAMPRSTPGKVPARTAPANDPAGQLAQLLEEHDANCPHCTTVETHTQTVFGEGNPAADLMFIGEAPGEEEDRTGRPFVGRAGQKLNDIIQAMGLSREDVYIANVLKSRPPNNRTPQPDEVEKCSPYLVRQIRIIQPKVIVTLGGPATKLLLDTNVGITRLRGTWAEYRDGDIIIPIMPTFHPAYLLRNYTKDTRQKVWSDMQAVLTRLGIAAPGKK